MEKQLPFKATSNLHRNNHYVPKMYLKRFCSDEEKLWTYRILVSHPNVPLWKISSPRGVGYHEHLYTSLAYGEETDKIECWLEKDFETPADEVLSKATSGARLTVTDWKHLFRFVAAQDVRTPARMHASFQRWRKTMPDIIDKTLEEAKHKLENAQLNNKQLKIKRTNADEEFPIKITKKTIPGEEKVQLKAETVIGRKLWLWQIKHLLTNTLKKLKPHRWLILSPPDDINWFTSDNPVIKLNYHNQDKYDFNGGWGSKGTEIIMPLSPKCLLYTQVGGEYRTNPYRKISKEEALAFQKLIAENAHRYVFSSIEDNHIEKLRPRMINANRLKTEREQWKRWNAEQNDAERWLNRTSK